jgi:hypothetical protein
VFLKVPGYTFAQTYSKDRHNIDKVNKGFYKTKILGKKLCSSRFPATPKV